MRSNTRRLLFSTALIVVAALGVAAALQVRAEGATDSRNDIVLMRCNTAEAGFPVKAYRGSSAAPAKRSEDCAETLSLLLKEGFAIRDVGYSDYDTDFVVYTLIR